VPLEWSNFASSLGLSGVASWVANPLKNNCENANTHTHDGVHLVVLAYLQRRRSWWWKRVSRAGYRVTRRVRYGDRPRPVFSGVLSDQTRPVFGSAVDRMLVASSPVWPDAFGRRWVLTVLDRTLRLSVRSISNWRVRSALEAYWTRPDTASERPVVLCWASGRLVRELLEATLGHMAFRQLPDTSGIGTGHVQYSRPVLRPVPPKNA
jgi:hypothetical protein